MSRPFAVFLRAASAAVLFSVAMSAEAVVEIQWWHSMTGKLGDKVNEIATKFNASQGDYKVTPVYKGQYDESMAAAIAAYRAGNPPQIVQVFEVGTATMMAAKGAIKPVYQLMAESGEKFDPKAYPRRRLRLLLGHAGPAAVDAVQQLVAGALHQRRRVQEGRASIPTKPPKTWPEVGQAAEKLKASGATCAFTTGWQSWVQLESFSAWHNVPVATKENGFGGLDTRLEWNEPVKVKHIQTLGDWSKKGLFTYAGRKDEPLAKFTSGDCAMITTSSGSYANIKANAKFNWRVARLPYWADVTGAPQNTIIGGATLWVLTQKDPAVYKGIAKFFTFLSSPEVQADWHQATGYVPITIAAYELTKSQGFYEKNPGFDIAIGELNNKPPTANSKGVRFGNFVEIRNINDEELEQVWNGQKTAKQALDEAVRRGNEQLERFQKANQ